MLRLCLAVLAASSAALAQPTASDLAPGTVRALPALPDPNAQPVAEGVSATGEHVAGAAWIRPSDGGTSWPPPPMRPFLWSAADGYRLIDVPDSLGLIMSGARTAISADGTTVVGTSHLVEREPTSSAQARAFRWTAASGLRWLTPPGTRSDAVAASADGAVVVGHVRSPTPSRAVRWNADGTVAEVEPLDGHRSATLRDVSADGAVVVGISTPPSTGRFDRTAIVWTADGGTQPVPGLDAYSHSDAMAVSADGLVVVGYAYDGPLSNMPGAVAWRWSRDGELKILGTWTARAVSADGGTVVGSYRSAVAIVWTEAGGERQLRDVVDADGWWLARIDGVSADGLVLLGQGEAPGGTDASWRARLSKTP